MEGEEGEEGEELETITEKTGRVLGHKPLKPLICVDSCEVLADLVEWQNAPREVLHILQNLGFREETEATEATDAAPSASSPLKQLSGGWRMKAGT